MSNSMKQHIILEQLREIDSEIIAIKLLRTGIMKKKEGDLIRTEKFAKQFTIGKMIEILYKSGYGVSTSKHEGVKGQVWLQLGLNAPKKFSSPELCDCLWSAVKEVLSQ